MVGVLGEERVETNQKLMKIVESANALTLEEILGRLKELRPSIWCRYRNDGFSTNFPGFPSFNVCLYNDRDRKVLRLGFSALVHGWEFYKHFSGAKVQRLYWDIYKEIGRKS